MTRLAAAAVVAAVGVAAAVRPQRWPRRPGRRAPRDLAGVVTSAEIAAAAAQVAAARTRE